jgi:hypothetical protein
VTGTRVRGRRLGGILAASLFIIATLPGAAIAANTRFLWIGQPDLKVDTVDDGIFRPDNSGILVPSTVSVPATGTGPNATRFYVEIYNSGGQNLANTVLTVNADAKGLAGLDLNAAATYDPTGGDSASSVFCSTSGDVITCDYGSLPSGATRTIAVVVNVSDAFTATDTSGLFTASVTTNNENGSNFQTFGADSGTFKVSAFGDNSLSTFLLEGNDKHLFTSPTGTKGGNLSTDVKFNAANKELVSINEDSSGDGTTGFYKCPSGLSCQSLYSEVTTTTGSFSSAPFFTWTLTAVVPKTYSLAQGFLAHYPTGAKTFDFTDTTNAYWILYFKDKSALCPLTDAALATKIASAHQCIYTPTLVKIDKSTNLLTIKAVMDHQGGAKY